jgi:hypothetical protein
MARRYEPVYPLEGVQLGMWLLLGDSSCALVVPGLTLECVKKMDV